MNSTTPQPAEDIASWFAAGWREPGSLDAFCDHFLPRMHPDVVLIQPLAGKKRGHDSFRQIFARLFTVIPDLRAGVIRWAAAGDHLFIELELHGRIGGLPIHWRTTDRLLIADGLVTERRSYFNPSSIVLAVITRPWAWPQILLRTLLASRHTPRRNLHRSRCRT